MKVSNKIIKRFKDYMKRTWKNKLLSIFIIIIGLVASNVYKTMLPLVFMGIYGLIIFFVPEDVTNLEEEP